jgi:uncharacterized protein YfaS (alpha-2-macroglobulin family)
VQRVESARATLRPTSTQEDAWLLLAASALTKDGGKVSLDVGGTATQRALYRTIRAGDLKEPVRITNTGEDQVQAVVTVTGAPTTPEPAAEKGFKIERKTYTLAGDPIDTKEVKQNTRMVGAQDHRIATAIRTRGARRLSASRVRDRQSASRLVG